MYTNVLLLYSPFFNPIENMFEKWKHLFEMINNDSNLITSDYCAGYFRNIFAFLPTCLNKTVIFDDH